MEIATILSLGFLALVIVALAKTARIVPQRSAFIIERLGKYAKTLDAGFHILIPFVDRVAYKHTLKEEAIDVPSQACVTRDNIQVVVDGVLYLQVVDPKLELKALRRLALGRNHHPGVEDEQIQALVLRLDGVQHARQPVQVDQSVVVALTVPVRFGVAGSRAKPESCRLLGDLWVRAQKHGRWSR